ncbi:MAG: hypothetical protein E7550_01295 [Ruminococcaceae bacterium]|nr:hypothetical protein [Oscillospiraceae bacterium]
MSKKIRILSVILCFCLTISYGLSFISAAEDNEVAVVAETPTEALINNKTAYVNGEDVNIRSTYSTSGQSLGKVSFEYVTVSASYTFSDGKVWYKVTYGSITGYMYGYYVHIIEPVVPEGTFAEQLATFPESYHASLNLLHQLYPNWNFVADNINIDFATAVYNEGLGHRKLVNMTGDGISWRALGPENYNWTTGKWNTYSGNWTDASKEVIEYYMDPRNFLDATSIYMFMQQSYSEGTASETELAEFVADSYLGKGFPADQDEEKYGGSYVKIILEAAKQANINPYVLASTLILEQGREGKSDLISGTTEKYPGYYNFFNYKASGDDVILNGLKYAKEQGWDSRSKSIIGGAKLYAKGYIAIGQDTYYYKDFDVQDASPYTHQYAQSIYDHRSSAKLIREVYMDKKNLALTFRIPVYKNMYEKAPAYPTENDTLNNYYFNEISVDGLSPAFSRYTQSYKLSVSKDTTVYVKVPSTARYSGNTTYALKKGTNTVKLAVRSQSGYDNYYTLTVTAAADCTLTISTDAKKIMRGDANGDDTIDIIDLAAIRLHILGKRKLTGNNLDCADANNDGTIDIIDLAAVRLNILGKLTLN